MWKFAWDRLAVSLLLMTCFGIFAWLNILTQREQILVSQTGIEVSGRVILKGQTMQSNGRGNTWVNSFVVHYFDVPTDDAGKPLVGEPLVLELLGKEIVLREGRAAIGDFHSYEIENIPDEIYEQTAEEDPVSLLYLPGAPEKAWLKATVAGKTSVDPSVPGTFIAIGLLLALIPLIDWTSIWHRLLRRMTHPTERDTKGVTRGNIAEHDAKSPFPLVLYGNVSVVLFMASMGSIMLLAGIGSLWYATTSFGELAMNRWIVIPVIGVLATGIGTGALYMVLWTYPYQTVFTAQRMTQNFFTHQQTQSMCDVVDIQQDEVIRTSRRIPYRVYQVTFHYANAAPFHWIPHEFDFPLGYKEADATALAGEWVERLRSAYPVVDQSQVGKLAEIPGIVVTDRYEDDAATYISFVLREGQEETGIQALVEQMENDHAICLSEYAGGDLFHYVRKREVPGQGLGYELLKSDVSAAGEWEPNDYESAIWWLIPVADQNLEAVNGVWPATYWIPKNG